MSSIPHLFSPLQLGPRRLDNRIVMAPMTRCRAEDHLPNELMLRYYVQRASAGLIVTEATQVHPASIGYSNTPGIHSREQVAGWRRITDAVHRHGGVMFLQLWHVGRIAHPAFPGAEAIGPSPIAARGSSYTPDGARPFVIPREMTVADIRAVVTAFADGSVNARAAGFDGVEIHGANGYLIDQFLRDGTNRRSDDYGGTPDKRSRLLLEITAAAVEVFGADRVGVRLSPSGTYNDMRDSDPAATFLTAARLLSELPLAYLHVVEASEADLRHGGARFPTTEIRRIYRGRLMVNGGYDGPRAEAALASGEADLVSFGGAFLANPDLPARLRKGAALNHIDSATLYSGGEQGYIDYPPMA